MFSIYECQLELKIMEGPHEDLRGYLAAVDELYTNVEFFTRNGSFKSSGSALNHVHGLLAKAMTRLEEAWKRNKGFFDQTHRLRPKKIDEGNWVLVYDNNLDN